MMNMLSESVQFSEAKRLTNFLVISMHFYWPVILLSSVIHKNEGFDASLSSTELEKKRCE